MNFQDTDFSSSSTLEIFRTDSPSTTPLGALPLSERFSSLAWGHTPTADALPLGIIAGGHSDGSIGLYNPSALLDASSDTFSSSSSFSPSPGRLAHLDKHTYAVRGLDLNPLQSNLLASASGPTELCIWDISDFRHPALYQSPVTDTSHPTEVVALAWNRKVQHILATLSATARAVVWDLRRDKPVISFGDPTRTRGSAFAWHPNVATQLVVASEDDRHPSLQLWDLRNSSSPIREFTGHTSGVLSVSWSTDDPRLLLSAAKDHRVLCWDTSSAGALVGGGSAPAPVPATPVVTTLDVHPHWALDVRWSRDPRARGLFAVSTMDGAVGLHHVTSCARPQTVQEMGPDFQPVTRVIGAAPPMTFAPNWMPRKAVATFGFGGRLVSCCCTSGSGSSTTATGVPGTQVTGGGSATTTTAPDQAPRMIQISHVVRDAGATAVAMRVLQHVGDRSAVTLRRLAKDREKRDRNGDGDQDAGDQTTNKTTTTTITNKTKISSSPGWMEGEAEAWAFVRAQFELEARTYLLSHLGYPVQPPHDDTDQVVRTTTTTTTTTTTPPALGVEGADAFFEGSPDNALSLPAHAGAAATEMRTAKTTVTTNHHHAPEKSPTGLREEGGAGLEKGGVDLDGRIGSQLMKGDYVGAVESCLSDVRYTDALLLAALGGPELLAATHEVVLQHTCSNGPTTTTTSALSTVSSSRSYMQIAAAAMGADLTNVLEEADVTTWRHTLALLCTFASSGDTFRHLASQLANKLEVEGLAAEAALVYTAAGEAQDAIRIWTGFADAKEVTDRMDDLDAATHHRDGVLLPSARGNTTTTTTTTTTTGDASCHHQEPHLELAIAVTIAAGRADVPAALAARLAALADKCVAGGRVDLAQTLLNMVGGGGGGGGHATHDVAELQQRLDHSWDSRVATRSVPPPFAVEEVGVCTVVAAAPAATPIAATPTPTPAPTAAAAQYASPPALATSTYMPQVTGHRPAEAAPSMAAGVAHHHGSMGGAGGWGAPLPVTPSPPSHHHQHAPSGMGAMMGAAAAAAAAAAQPAQALTANRSGIDNMFYTTSGEYAKPTPTTALGHGGPAPPPPAPTHVPTLGYQGVGGSGGGAGYPNGAAPGLAVPTAPGGVGGGGVGGAGGAGGRGGYYPGGAPPPAAAAAAGGGQWGSAAQGGATGNGFPRMMMPGTPSAAVAAPEPVTPSAASAHHGSSNQRTPTGPPATATLTSTPESALATLRSQNPGGAKLVTELRRLLGEIVAFADANGWPAMKKKEIGDTDKKLAHLVWQISEGSVRPAVVTSLETLVAAMPSRQAVTVEQQVNYLVKNHFEVCPWLPGLKRMVKMYGIPI